MEKEINNNLKITLVCLSLFFQVVAYILIFFYLWPGLALLLGSYLLLAIILLLLAREKKEECNDDYRDY